MLFSGTTVEGEAQLDNWHMHQTPHAQKAQKTHARVHKHAQQKWNSAETAGSHTEGDGDCLASGVAPPSSLPLPLWLRGTVAVAGSPLLKDHGGGEDPLCSDFYSLEKLRANAEMRFINVVSDNLFQKIPKCQNGLLGQFFP